MFEMNIFKKQVKNNWLLALICFSLPPVLLLIIAFAAVTGYDASSMRFPIAMLIQELDSQMLLFVPIIFCIICSNRMVVSEIQSGALTYVASSPVSRTKIIGSKMSFLLLSQLYGFLFNVIAITLIYSSFQNQIDMTYGAMFMNVLGIALLVFALSGISFFFSTYYDKVLLSHVTGTVLIAVFYFLAVISTVAESIESLKILRFTKYLTVNSFFNYSDFSKSVKYSEVKTMVEVNNSATPFICYASMFLIGLGLFFGSGVVFVKKDLPL